MESILNRKLISKYYKKQLMDLGFRHSEAKCLLRGLRHNQQLYFFLKYPITDLTMFCMYDLIYAEICINGVYKYSKLFHKTSHKTKKILSSWFKKHHSFIGKKCKCVICDKYYLLLKLSEYTDSNDNFKVLSPAHVSLVLFLFFHKTNKQLSTELRFYIILFELVKFNNDFTNEHKYYFYNKLEEYFNNKRKMIVFEKLSKNILPIELISNVRHLVLDNKT